MPQSKRQSWTGKTRGGSFGYSFFIWLIRSLGPKAAYAFLCLIIPYFIPFAPKATKANWIYARNILSYGLLKSCAFLFINYYRLGQTLIDKIAISVGKKELYHFEFGSEYDEFIKLLQSNEPVILVGAHLGSWEMGAPFFDEYGKKMHVVLYDAEYQRIKELLAQNGKKPDYQVIPVNKDSLAHVFAIQAALNNNEYVCLQGDRFTDGAKTSVAKLMGKPADFPAGPFILASKFKVATVFYFATREKGMSYRFHFQKATPVDRTQNEKPEQQILKQYTQALEEILGRYPEQWFNYYPFWNEY